LVAYALPPVLTDNGGLQKRHFLAIKLKKDYLCLLSFPKFLET